MKNEVGARVKELRLEKGMTQQQMADILKIDRGNYSRYESGKFQFNNEMLIIICKYFNITAGQLLGLEDLS